MIFQPINVKTINQKNYNFVIEIIKYLPLMIEKKNTYDKCLFLRSYLNLKVILSCIRLKHNIIM